MLSRNLQDYLVVTLMAVLIWLYAEARNVQVYSPMEPVPVTVRVTGKDMVVLDQKPTRVTASFKGAQAELDKLRRMLGIGIHLDLSFTEPGTKSLPLADVIRDNKPLNQLNVNLTRIDPQTLDLVVDRLATVPVSVVFAPKDVQLASGSVRIDPPALPLTIPQSRLEQLGDPANLTLEAVSKTDLQTLAPGIEHTVSAQVSLPSPLAGEHVRLGSKEVRVTFMIEKRDDSIVVPSVPVWISAPPTDLGTYSVRLHEDSRVLKDVKLVGPADLIQKVRDKSLRVIAVLRLSTDDLATAATTGEVTGQASLVLPPEISVEDLSNTVRYTVTRLNDATP